MQRFYRKIRKINHERRYQHKKNATGKSFGSWVKNGSAIFTIVSGVVSAITLYYLYSQYKTSLKPDIIINDANAAMIVERYNTNGYIHYCFANDSIDRRQLIYKAYTSGSTYIISPAAEYNSFVFNLTNVGLGVAKNIELSWSFDTLAVIKVFNDHMPVPYLDSIKAENSSFIFFDKEGKNYYHELIDPRDSKINYIIPINSSAQTASSKLPYLYLRLYSCFAILSNFIQTNSTLTKEIKGEFPPLHLRVTYYDISNNIYHRHYLISIKDGSGSYSEFQLNMKKKIRFEEL